MVQDKNLKLEYLDALTKLINILSSQPMAFQFKFPQKIEIVTFMMVSTTQEDGGRNAQRREDGSSSWKPLAVLLD